MENFFTFCYWEKIIGYMLWGALTLFWIIFGFIMIIKEKRKH